MKTSLTPHEALRGLFMRESARQSWQVIAAVLDTTPYRLRLALDPQFAPVTASAKPRNVKARRVSRETSPIYV